MHVFLSSALKPEYKIIFFFYGTIAFRVCKSLKKKFSSGFIVSVHMRYGDVSEPDEGKAL